MMTRRKRLCLTVVTLLVFITITFIIPQSIQAGEYPEKALTMIVPFAAGGGNDRWARIMSTVAIEHFGQPFHVVNIPGAQATMGWQEMLNLPADGYSMIISADAPVMALLMEEDPPFSPTEISIVTINRELPMFLLARPGSPLDTWDKCHETISQRPRSITLGGTLSATIAHAYVLEQLGLETIIITYTSTSEAMTDFLGGHIDLVSVTAASAVPLIEDNKAVAVLNSGDYDLGIEELDYAVNASDLGVEGFALIGWIGCHPDTPAEIVEYANKAFYKIFNDPSFLSIMRGLGEDPIHRSVEDSQRIFNGQVNRIQSGLKNLGLID